MPLKSQQLLLLLVHNTTEEKENSWFLFHFCKFYYTDCFFFVIFRKIFFLFLCFFFFFHLPFLYLSFSVSWFLLPYVRIKFSPKLLCCSSYNLNAGWLKTFLAIWPTRPAATFVTAPFCTTACCSHGNKNQMLCEQCCQLTTYN